MNQTTLPKAKDWNHYWSLDQTQQFTKISWSKRRMIHILNHWTRQGQWALDAGCGSGFFAQYFCQQGMSTVALDYSQEALAIAKAKTQGRAQILQKDLLASGLSQEIPERFDLIFSDGLMEHFSLSDQDKIFKNFFSLLRPEGALVTFVPNRFSPWELIRPLYMPGIEETPFILKELIDLNKRNGFKIIQQGGVNTLPFAFSPDHLCGAVFGMLLFTIAKKK